MATAPGENPYLSTRPLPIRQKERSDDIAAAPGQNQYLATRQSERTDDDGIEAPMATAPGENSYLIKLPLTPAKSKMTDDDGIEAPMATATCENPYLLTRPLPTTQSRSTSDWTAKQLQWMSASTEAAWESSQTAWQSVKRGEQTNKIAQTSALALAPIEAARSSDVAQQLTKRRNQTSKIVQSSALALTSSEAAWESSKIAWESITGEQRTAEKSRTQKKGKSPKVREEAGEHTVTNATARFFSHVEIPVKRPIVRARHQTVMPPPQPKSAVPATDRRPPQRDPPSSSQRSQPLNPSQDSKIQKIPTKNPAQQHYSKRTSGGWRVLNARDAAIEIQKEHRAWSRRKRIAEGKCKEAAESERQEESNRGADGSQSPSLQPSFTRPPTSDGIKSINPPGKRKRGDYEGLISCRPRDKLWKYWENKHLLCSYAAGSSFAQISASREFSNGLVIRSEQECQERYKTLNEWQPLQDEELLRIGETEANEDFARICSVNFSRGLVKRSAEQCKERFEFLRKSEFEGF